MGSPQVSDIRLAIFDSDFPQAQPLGFRNIEFNYYLAQLPSARVFSIAKGTKKLRFPDSKGAPYSLGKTLRGFLADRRSYGRAFPQWKARVAYSPAWPFERRVRADLAYAVFLNVAYTVVDYLEDQELPFVFTLYPGGGFGIDNPHSDQMLARVLGSRQFRGVITTQDLTESYLLRKKFCSREKIFKVFGAFSQIDKETRRREFPRDKSTLDFCFVAFRYTADGRDKGLDVFLRLAEDVTARYEHVRFHIFGPWEEQARSNRNSRIIFHGTADAVALSRYFESIDGFISPNRPFQIYPGNFDGFPLGADAAVAGAALFLADPLHLNAGRFRDDELVTIDPENYEGLLALVCGYVERPELLYAVAVRGSRKARVLFSVEAQCSARLEIFSNVLSSSHQANKHPLGASK